MCSASRSPQKGTGSEPYPITMIKNARTRGACPLLRKTASPPLGIATPCLTLQSVHRAGPASLALLLLWSVSALAQSPATPPDAVIELWEQNWTLGGDGSIVYHERQHVRLNNERAHGEFADPRITYNADTDQLEILVARVKRPDGTYRELPDYSHVEVAPGNNSGWPAFAGIRQHVVVMSGIEPGCLVELEYKITTRPGARPYLTADLRLDHRYPIRERKISVDVPPNVKLRSVLMNYSPSQDGSSTDMRTWTFHDLPAAPDGPQSPPWQTRSPRLMFSTADGASHWLKHRTAQLEAAAQNSDLITRLATEWIKDKEGPSDKLRALQEKLAASFNFIELPVEWRPSTIRPAPEVLRSNYGLPEEAAAVLLALARAVRLPVCPGLLINDDVWHRDAPQDAMVAAYVVLLVGSAPEELELTPTPDGLKEYYAKLDTGEAPEIWDPHHGRLRRTTRWAGHTILPVPDVLMPRIVLPAWTDAADSRCHVRGKVIIAEDGTFTGSLTLRTTGLFVTSESLRSSDAQKSRISALLGRILPDINVESFTVTALAPGNFEVSAQIKSAKPLKKLGDAHCLQLAQDGPFLADVPMPLTYTRRATPARLSGAFDEDTTITFEWPEKWQLVAQPADLPPGDYICGCVEQSATTDQHSLSLHRRTRIAQRELSADDFLTLRTLLNEARSERARTLLLKP